MWVRTVNQNESKASIRRQLGQKQSECLQSPSGGTYTDYPKIGYRCRLRACVHLLPVSWPPHFTQEYDAAPMIALCVERYILSALQRTRLRVRSNALPMFV